MLLGLFLTFVKRLVVLEKVKALVIFEIEEWLEKIRLLLMASFLC